MSIYRRLLLGAFAACILPPAAGAQEFPGFGSLEARVGAAMPDDADAGFSASVDLGLGFLGSPMLRTLAGFNYFAASVNRESGTNTLEGDLTAVGGRVGVRLDPFGAARFAPYLAATVTGHSVDVTADAPAEQDLLDDVYGGFLVGAGLGVGATYALDVENRYALTAEARRVFVTDMAHWAVELGVRVTPRGRNAYVARGAPAAPSELEARNREALARAERARLEVEQLTTDRERMEAERVRAERERTAQLTDAERMRAQQEADALRQRVDTLEVARRREAEARVAAERETAAARERAAMASAQAEAAAAAARAAEMRAEAAERQFYDALVDLDRLMANVTEIRETERGLAVVLGQGLFASGQSALSDQARGELGRIAAVLGQFPDRDIVVAGHTDAAGSEVANQRLSELRAESVRAGLIAQGLNPARVTMVGYGEGRPVADNETPAGRAQNRRVEMVIVGARRPAVTPRP